MGELRDTTPSAVAAARETVAVKRELLLWILRSALAADPGGAVARSVDDRRLFDAPTTRPKGRMPPDRYMRAHGLRQVDQSIPLGKEGNCAGGRAVAEMPRVGSSPPSSCLRRPDRASFRRASSRTRRSPGVPAAKGSHGVPRCGGGRGRDAAVRQPPGHRRPGRRRRRSFEGAPAHRGDPAAHERAGNHDSPSPR